MHNTLVKNTQHKKQSLPLILQNTTFWRWCSYFSIEFQNVSLEINVSETQCIKLESMNFTLNNIHNNIVSQSILFTSSSFKILLNNIKFTDFYTLRIHAFFDIDKFPTIQDIDIKWNGIKLYLNQQNSDFMLKCIHQNKQNKQNRSMLHKQPKTCTQEENKALHWMPRYVSIVIEYIGIDIMHADKSLEFGIKSLETKLFANKTAQFCLQSELSFAIFCDAYSSNQRNRHNLMDIQSQIISAFIIPSIDSTHIQQEHSVANSICVHIIESSLQIHPTLISWIEKAIEYKLYLTQHNVLHFESEHNQNIKSHDSMEKLCEWKNRNIIIEYRMNNSVLNICDASEDLVPAYSFSVDALQIIFTSSAHMQHCGHLFMNLDCMTFSLGNLITKNISRMNQFMLNIMINMEHKLDEDSPAQYALLRNNAFDEYIQIMFDACIESVSIGINHEYISTATALIHDYGDVFVSLISKLSPDKNKQRHKDKSDAFIMSRGQIKCNTFALFTCFTEDSDDEKYNANEITVRMTLKELQIMKNLSKEYEEVDINTPNDLRHVPKMPTFYEWIVDFQSFQVMLSSESSIGSRSKHKKLRKKQPLLRISHSKCEQYGYSEDRAIRNIWIGELLVDWDMIQHLSLCRLFRLFYVHAQQLQSQISPFVHILSNTSEINKEETDHAKNAVFIPTLFSTNSIEIDMKFDYKSNDGTMHLYIDTIERPSYLTVYRDRFEAFNIDIFSSSITIKPDRNIYLPYILHDDELLHEAYIECYKQYYNQMEDILTPPQIHKQASPQKSYFQNKRDKSHKMDKKNEDVMSLTFHSASDDNWKTYILEHGSFGIGAFHDLIEFDHLKLYHSLETDNAYTQTVTDIVDEIHKEYHSTNTNQPNLNLSFRVFMFKLPHAFCFGDALFDSILKRWKAFKLWFKYTLMQLPQNIYHVPITLDFANIILSAQEFQIAFKEDPHAIKRLIDQFMDITDEDDTLSDKFEYFNCNMNRWSFANGFNIHNEHDLSMIVENIFRVCGDKLYIALELDERCLTFDDTLQMLQQLDSYQPPIDDVLVTSLHPWYELWGKHLIVQAKNVCATVSGYALPFVSTPYLEVNGVLVIGQLLCPKQRFIEHLTVDLSHSVSVKMESHEFIPTKVYYDLKGKIYGKESLITYGKCMEAGIDKLSLCMDRITKSEKVSPFGPLSWWDKLRMKIHGTLEINVKHTIICVIKDNHLPNYLSVDIDHGLFVCARKIFSLAAHSVSMQVITPSIYFKRLDIFKVKQLAEMYEIDAVNKDHTVARIHVLRVKASCVWQSKQEDAFQHYFHHTYWSNSVFYEEAIPDVDMDLYQRYRAQKLTMKYKVEIKAPTQQNTKIKTFLPGLDLRLWWKCKDWLWDLLDRLTESASSANKPELGPLLEPITLECSFMYPSIEILHILKEKAHCDTMRTQDLTIDIEEEEVMLSSPNTCSPMSPSIKSKPSTPSKILKRSKFKRRKAKDSIRRTNSLTEESMDSTMIPAPDSIRSTVSATTDSANIWDEAFNVIGSQQTYRLLGMRVRAKELLFRSKFIRSSQNHPLLDSEIVTTQKDDIWLMKGKYLKLSKPKLELIVPSTKKKKKSKDVFYHVSPFKAENCYGNFQVARFARSAHLVFSDMGYHKAEQSVKRNSKQNKFKFPHETHPIPKLSSHEPILIQENLPLSSPHYTKFRPPPLDSVTSTVSLPSSPPTEQVASNPAAMRKRTSSVNLLLNTEMLTLNRARGSVEDMDLESIPSSKCADLISPNSNINLSFDQNEFIRTLTESHVGNTTSPDDSMSPIKFMKDDITDSELASTTLSAKVRRNSFQLAPDLLMSPSIFGGHSWDEQPGNSTIYDSWVLDDLKLLWNEQIRQTTLHWWPLLFEKAQNEGEEDLDDDDDDTNNDDNLILHEERELNLAQAQDLVSSLSQLLESASNNQKPRIVTDDDDGEGSKTKERKDDDEDGRQPADLEYYKQRLWLVHLQRPQIKFEAVNGDAVLLGAHNAFVQGFGFHLELLPNRSKDVLKHIRSYLPPQEMIYRLNNTQFYDDVMPYFKIRICGSLIDAQMFVAPSNIDHIEKWIPSNQLQHHSESTAADKVASPKMKTRSRAKTRIRRRSRENIKIKKDNTIKAVVGHCKLQFAYSYDLEIPNNYSHKILPFHWRSFAENNIVSSDYETDSFVPNNPNSATSKPKLFRNNKINSNLSYLTSPSSPQKNNSLIRHLYHKAKQSSHSAHSFASDPFSKLSATSMTPPSSSSHSQHSLHDLHQNTFCLDSENEQKKNENDTKPDAYKEWIGRQHIPFIDDYKGEATSNTKVYLPQFVGKLDPYQFQTFVNVINFVLLASHQSDEQNEELIYKNNISITKQQRHRIQNELQQTVNKSTDSTVNKSTPTKIVEYQANSIAWKMADTNGNTFLNTEITNISGSHILCSDLSREADVELQHFQVSRATKTTKAQHEATKEAEAQAINISASDLLSTPSVSKQRSHSPSTEHSLASESCSSVESSKRKKKKKKKNKFFKKINNIFNTHNKSKSTSPEARDGSCLRINIENPVKDCSVAIGEESPMIDIDDEEQTTTISSEADCNNCKIMIQPQPEAWKRFQNNAIQQRSRRMMLTIRAENAKPHKLKSCFADKKINIPFYRHLEMNLFPVRIDLDIAHAKQLRDYFFIVTENESKNRNTKQHKKQFLNYFEKQYNLDTDRSSANTMKSFTFSENDEKIGEALMRSSNSVNSSSNHNSLSDERYFHRIRIGRLSFDVSFTGWLTDIHKDISVSTFIYTNRLSTWSKLIHSLGSHAFRDVVFGSVTHSHLNPLQLDNLLIDKKKKKKFQNLNDTAKRQRLLFGDQSNNAAAEDDDDCDILRLDTDAICVIEVDFDKYSLIKMMMNQNDSDDAHDDDDQDAYDADVHLQELFEDSLIVKLIHDRLVLELRTVLEHVYGTNNLFAVFDFEMLNKLHFDCFKLKLFLKKIGEFDYKKMENDEFDLIEKYRICLQSLIVAKYETKQHQTNLNLADVIKYLYNAKNITIQPIKSYI